jgi:molybdate/tungstate transport system substrate-binding protein
MSCGCRIVFLGLTVSALCALGCGKKPPATEKAEKPEKKAGQARTELILFHADALALPFSQIEEKFEAENAEIDLKRESSGSNLAARKITDMGRPCDVIATADYRIIQDVLIPKHASWSIRFATNEIVVAYGNASKHANEIKTENWYKVLLRPDVSYGHSNPELDPCGYWTLIVWQLADLHYEDQPEGKKLSEALEEHCPAKNVRADLNELHPLLSSGVLDYAFMYRSVAQQHHLSYVKLPPEINLGDPAHDATYHKASIVVKDKKGGSVTRTGTAIVFAITILDDAPHKEQAVRFLQYLFGPVGKKIMADNGQGLLDPLLARKGQPVPAPFDKMVKFEE